MRSLESGSVDCIASDVPYRIVSGAGGTKHKAGWRNSVLKDTTGKIFKHNDVKAEDYFPEMHRVLKNGGHCYIFTNNLNLTDTITEGEKAGFKFSNMLYWKKNTKNTNRYYMKCVEMILFFYKKPAVKINDCGTSHFLEFNNPRNKKHPTEKPVELMRVMIENSTHYGQVVLDPFAGSGSTLIAARESGRRFIGCELDEMYFYAACGRLGAI